MSNQMEAPSEQERIDLSYKFVRAISDENLIDLTDCLKKGADPNYKMYDDWTPMHWAAYKENTEIQKILIQFGADIDPRNTKGHTPVHFAVNAGKIHCLETLVSLGADINKKSNNFDAALHMCAQSGKIPVCKRLLDMGAVIDDRGNKLRTPLHVACLSGNIEIAIYLITQGASMELKDEDNRTPLESADFFNKKEAMLAMIAYGADTYNLNARLHGLEDVTMHRAAAQGGFTDRLMQLLREKPSEIRGNSPESLAKLANLHGKSETSATVHSMMAANAIEEMICKLAKAYP